MSVEELQVIAGFLERATCPEDVFGNGLHGTKNEQEDSLKKSYHQLVKALHPDKHAGDPASLSLAGELFQQIEEFHKEAESRLKKGTYGNKVPLAGRTPTIVNGKYVLEKGQIEGDIASLYVVSLESSKSKGGYRLKVARNADDNDLMRTERNVLKDLASGLPKDTWRNCVPQIKDSFLVNDQSGPDRSANVLTNFDGFLTSEEIRKKVKGVDGRTLAWMWKRLLVLLEWTHKLGYIHGAILPPHVLFYPDNDGSTVKDIRKHSVRLVDWCYSIELKSRTRLSAWVPKYKDFYAPEIIAKEKLGPYTDLYMGAATMVYLAGGEFKPKKAWFPNTLPIEIQQSLLECLNSNPERRPQHIGKYFDSFKDLLLKVYGRPAWHEFTI